MFNLDQIIKSLQSDPGNQRTAMTGAAGLAAGLLLGGGGGFGGLARMGAIAAIGGLAYNAWQKQQRGGEQPASRDAFIPNPGARAEEELGKSLVRAMIAAAKADGRIDAEEKERIFKRLETMALSAEEKAFVFDELSGPLDIEAVVARADTPEHAAEIYAASLVAMSPDTPEEQSYLATLGKRLGLSPQLIADLHRGAVELSADAGQNAPSPGNL